MTVRAFHEKGIAPVFAVIRARSVPHMVIQIQRPSPFGNEPGTRIDEQLVFKDEEVWIASVAASHAEGEHFRPVLPIIAAENDDAGRAERGVSIGAAAEGEEEAIAIPAEVRERVVVGVPAGSPHGSNINGGQSTHDPPYSIQNENKLAL